MGRPRCRPRSRGTARPARWMRSTQPATTSRGLQRRARRRPRVADQAGRPADQAERPVPGPLQVAQREQLHQVADVQARRRRVEAAVERDRSVRRARSAARPRRWSAPPGHATAARRGCRHGRALVGRRVPRRPSLPYAARRVCDAVSPGRYTDTVGSSASQNRHGTSRVAAGAATRPPAARSGPRAPAPACRCAAPAAATPAAQRRAPSCDAGQAERRGQPGRPAGQVAVRLRRRPARARASSSPSTTSPARSSTARRAPVRTADDVGAPVHAVGEVDVEVPGRAEHHRVARGPPPERVRPRVVLARRTPRPR